MPHIILERQFDGPMSPEAFKEMGLEHAACLKIYRVEWRESLLAEDGSRLTCRFESPDTESVRRIAERQGRTTSRIAWPGAVHDTGREGTANVVVERRFDEPTAVEALQAIEDAGAWCLDLHKVTFLRTFCSGDSKRMICLYRAPDAESVRLAQTQAGMPVERVWACQAFDLTAFM